MYYQILAFPLRQPLLEPRTLLLCTVINTVAADRHVRTARRKTIDTLSVLHFFHFRVASNFRCHSAIRIPKSAIVNQSNL